MQVRHRIGLVGRRGREGLREDGLVPIRALRSRPVAALSHLSHSGGGSVHAMGPPLVSLLMPVRNMAHTVKRALDSVRADLAPSDQIVLVDDQSTDGTGELLQAF